ncbi:alpha-glucosidase [Balneatrix alpica]|uniref:Alpha-glucosidase n=1 Tax=Balneatrix alpica TaxID=75684 RepID=A0ABV5ZCN2_9GAMM|nr:alpha-glucosidase [Balneatrix alpica]
MDKANLDWWRGGVIYQIYPRSFMDANNDGVGDLPGITAKLDYIAGLNVDAIWISPIFTSPMRDFGYDVSNYKDIDPLFGTLADFDNLVQQAHQRGLKVVIDQVLSHTSDQHPWFEQSRSSRDNPKADWYVWADPQADGTPPNNWLSVFGGSAWSWDSRRKQYYLHNFLSSQPDLNFHNPQVVEAMLDVMRFWLERGVDGFRLDTANFFFHDKLLRSNPANEEIRSGAIGVRPDNPYGYQRHLYDKTQPENIGFLQQVRALMDEFPGSTTVGEIGCDFSLRTMAEYTSGGDKLHMAYSFDFLTEQCSPAFIRHTIETIEAGLGDGWPCWSSGNHDVVRVMSRWGLNSANPAQAKLFMQLLLTLRGSVCLYQGEELALPEAELSFDQLVDPYGIRFWPEFKGRDGCRTPMPWQANQPHAGFSQAEPWLPVVSSHLELAVDQQDQVADSVLNAYRDFLAWRRQQPALIQGGIQFLAAPEGCLLYQRAGAGQRLLVALNFTEQEQTWALTQAVSNLSDLPACVTGKLQGQQLNLPAFGVAIVSLAE